LALLHLSGGGATGSRTPPVEVVGRQVGQGAMEDPGQAERAALLRALHAGPAVLVLPNAWDAASARLFEEAGFPAVATSSAGIANALGYPDGGFIPRDELAFMVQRISSTVSVPVSVDIEAGLGTTEDDILATVRA